MKIKKRDSSDNKCFFDDGGRATFRESGKAVQMTRRTLTTGLAIAISFLMNCGFVSAQGAGGTVSCYCYCGISLPAPCGDDACKRACEWKGGSSGNSLSGVNSGTGNAAYQAGYQLGQGLGKLLFGDPQEQEREQERALQQQRQIMRSVDEIAREHMRSEDDMLRNAADRARRLDDQRRDETLSSLTGIPNTDELTLKPATDFFGIPGNPKGDLSSQVDPNAPQESRQDKQKQKVGTGTMDCERARIARDRLAAGLRVQLKTIKRTEEQLKQAQKGVQEATAERNAVLIKGALGEVKAFTHGLLKTAGALRGQIEAFQGLDPAKRDKLIRTLHTIVLSAEDLSQSGKAGKEAAVEARKKVQNLANVIDEFNKFMAESGIADEASQEFLGELMGPWGEFGFRASKLAIDLSAAVYAGNISKEEQEAAQKNLYIMEKQYQRAKQHISELDRHLGGLCKEKPQARQ
jgi:hypothetical protein